MSSKYYWAILEEYKNSLFNKSQSKGYRFSPNEKIDAEYFYHNLIFELNKLEELHLPHAQLIEDGKETPDSNIMNLSEVEKSIRENSEMLQAIKSWYDEENKIPPPVINPFADQDEWEAMEDGFEKRVKTLYEEGLAAVKSKYSLASNGSFPMKTISRESKSLVKDANSNSLNKSEENNALKIANRELEIAHNVIIMQRQSKKLEKLTDQEFENLVEPHRFNNKRLNMTKAGRALKVSKDTIRREIKRRKLQHIIDQPKSK